MANLQLRLAHLYPKELNIYGDYGNVLTIQKRCEWRGIDIIIDEIKVGDSIKEHDLYFIGGGQDAQQIEVSKELLKNKEVLHKEKNADAVFLGICGGYQLMGNYYQPLDAERLEGIGLLDVYTIAGSARFIGNVTSKTNFIPKNNPNIAKNFISPPPITSFLIISSIRYITNRVPPPQIKAPNNPSFIPIPYPKILIIIATILPIINNPSGII